MATLLKMIGWVSKFILILCWILSCIFLKWGRWYN